MVKFDFMILKKILKIFVTLICLLVIVLFGLAYYLEQHKQDLFSKFENWYSENHNGVLTFDDLSISTFKNFPNVALELKNLVISDTIKTKTESLKIEDIRLLISLKNILYKEVQLKAIKIKNGKLNVITDKDGASNNDLFSKTKKNSTKNNNSQNWFSKNGIKITIEDFDIAIINHQKNKRITGYINDLYTKLNFTDSIVTSDVEMDIDMKEMGLNLEKGTFFNDANLTGEFNAVIHKKKQLITIAPFDLQIDEQHFEVTADFDTAGHGSFDFTLENPITYFETTVKLLSQNIQQKLKIYHLSKPIYTHTSLKGSFKPGSNILVEVNSTAERNRISINNKLQFDNVTFKASFVNRAYTDERSLTEGKKDIRLNFDVLNGVYLDIPFQFKRAILTSTPKIKTYIDYDIYVNSKTSVLNELFESDTFLFLDGTFVFESVFKGTVVDLNSLFDATQTRLAFDKSTLLYKPDELKITIDTIELDVNKKDGFLKLLTIPLKNPAHKIVFSGNVKNLSSLVSENGTKVSSELAVYSNTLVWDDFIYLFKTGKEIKSTTTSKQKDSILAINKILKSVYLKFNPQLNISIKKFQYQNLIVNELSTGIKFNTINAVGLNKTQFNYRKGIVAMDLNLDITKPNKTLFDIDFIAKNIDLGNLVKEFDYFGLNSLKEADKITGTTSVDVIMKGVVNDRDGLDTKSLKGSIAFDLVNLELSGFEPIQKIGDKIFKKERFEDIKFGPIKDTLFIADRTVEIPLLEIQSTAFELFVDGNLNYDNKTDIWVAIPLSNLKKRKDLLTVPASEGYADAGKKVFVEIKDDGTGKLDYKFHLSSKKYYEERGIIDDYKEDQKNDRKTKRQDKKNERILKKELKKQQ